MLTSSFVSLLAVSTVAYAQFALKITQPQDQEFIQIGATIPVDIQALNTPAGTLGPDIQLSLCTVITGLPLCNNTFGTVLLTAPFNPPDETYSVTIPTNQTAGLTRLVAGHITIVGTLWGVGVHRDSLL